MKILNLALSNGREAEIQGTEGGLLDIVQKIGDVNNTGDFFLSVDHYDGNSNASISAMSVIAYFIYDSEQA